MQFGLMVGCRPAVLNLFYLEKLRFAVIQSDCGLEWQLVLDAGDAVAALVELLVGIESVLLIDLAVDFGELECEAGFFGAFL